MLSQGKTPEFTKMGEIHELFVLSPKVGHQPAPYRGLSGPPGPESQKSLENVSGASGPGTPKSLQKVPLVFPRKNTRIHTKNGRNSYELFVLALSLVWFAGVTPESKLGPQEKWGVGWGAKKLCLSLTQRTLQY